MSTPATTDELTRYAGTKRASYSSTIVLAINNNIAPLFFIIFHVHFDVPIAQLGLLAALNFGVQFATDFVAMFFVDRIGYRAPMVWANTLSALGLAGLGIFPLLFDNTFLALCVAVTIYAIGGGLIEVLASPIIEHLPTPAHHKASAMAFLHSFYCWGQLLVVVATTLLVSALGRELWWTLPIMWAIIPLINAFAFTRVPLPNTVSADERTSIRSLFGTPLFLAALVLMMTGGAAELTMVQWASFFAEQGVGVSKEVGDLLGIGLFALLMGLVRFAYGMWGENLSLPRLLGWSGIGAGISYIVAATSNVPLVSLLACAVCGAMIALLWPGTMSLTSAKFPYGGAAMFAILALAGDGGASLGPALAGGIAEQATSTFAPIAQYLPEDGGSGLRTALLLCSIIPFIFSVMVWRFAKAHAKTD